MKGGTGVFIDSSNSEQNFINFLMNSNIEYLAKGSNGITFKATLKPGSSYVSTYKNIDYLEYGKPVNSLLIKLSILDEYSIINPITTEDFKREVNIQTDIFLKTMNTLQPLCPAIVFSKIYDKNISIDTRYNVLDVISKNMKHNAYSIFIFIDELIKNSISYTIIGMELIDKYNTVAKLMSDPTYNKTQQQTFIKMCQFIVIDMALKTGYSHADFHFSNIMINPNDTTYFDGYSGAVILIDFGFTVKLTPMQMSTIKNMGYSFDAMKYLCNVPRSDNYNIATNNHEVYSDICNTTDPTNTINELHIAREKSVENIINIFNSNTDRDKYPLLPLSNAIKNKMFPGLLEEQTISKDIIKLTFTDNNEKFDKFKIVALWISSVIKVFMNKNVLTLEQCIDAIFNSCYCTYYLMFNVNEFNKKSKYQLAGIVGMYVSGINEKYGYEIVSKDVTGKDTHSKDVTNKDVFKGGDIFETYEFFCAKAYTDDVIKNTCELYKEKLKNIHIVTILDFMTSKEINKYMTSLTNPNYKYIDKQIQNIDIYISPEEWVKKNVERTDTNTQHEYDYPFKTDENVFGGKIKKKSRKNRKSRKKSRKNRKNSKNKK